MNVWLLVDLRVQLMMYLPVFVRCGAYISLAMFHSADIFFVRNQAPVLKL